MGHGSEEWSWAEEALPEEEESDTLLSPSFVFTPAA